MSRIMIVIKANTTVHPLAEVFPDLAPPEFEKLIADIREHGLMNAIVMDGDVLIDGRQRLRACEAAGVEPKFVEFAKLGLKISVEDYIWSNNVNRRHLTDDQRAVLSIRWVDEVKKNARANSLNNLNKGTKRSEVADSPPRGKTRKELARRAHVSEHKIRQVQTLARRASHLLPMVESGEMKLKDADAATAMRGSKHRDERVARAKTSHHSASFQRQAQVDKAVVGFFSLTLFTTVLRFEREGLCDYAPEEVLRNMTPEMKEKTLSVLPQFVEWLQGFPSRLGSDEVKL